MDIAINLRRLGAHSELGLNLHNCHLGNQSHRKRNSFYPAVLCHQPTFAHGYETITFPIKRKLSNERGNVDSD